MKPFYSGCEACVYAEKHASGRFSCFIIAGHVDAGTMRHHAVIGADFFGSAGAWSFWFTGGADSPAPAGVK